MTVTTVRIARWWVAAALGALMSAAILVGLASGAPPVGESALPLGPVAVVAAADPPTLTLSPDPVTVGAKMSVTGSNHCPLYSQFHDGYFEVALGFGDGVVVRVQGIHGGFSAEMTAPSAPGSYVLTSTCLNDPSESGASKAFTVIKPDGPAFTPSVLVKPNAASPGDTVTVTAELLPSACTDGTMTLIFDSMEVKAVWAMFAGSPGGSTRFVVPSDASAGLHHVGVTCTTPAGASVDIPPADIAVGPPSAGPVGEVTSRVKTSTTTIGSTTSTGPVQTQSSTGTRRSSTTPVGTSYSATTPSGAAAGSSQTTAVVAGAVVPPGGAPPRRAAMATWLRPPTDPGLLDPRHLAMSAVLAVLLMLLIGFPAQLFEATYEENEERIKTFLRRHHVRGIVLARRHRHVATPLAIAGFALFGALLYGLTDRNFGRDMGQTLLDGVGFLVALPLVTLAFEIPAERYARRSGRIPGQLRVVPAALLIALGCAVVSYLGHFQPGYVYGLIAGYAALSTARLDRAESGRAVLVGSGCLALVAVVAWILWAPLDSALALSGAEVAQRVLDAVLASVVVVSVQALAFQLLPLTFLDGHAVNQWSRTAWRVAYALSLFALIAVTFYPRTRNDTTDPQILMMVVLFASFGLASIAFWAWFRYRSVPVPPRRGGYAA
jgi:hypothetical protein